MVNMSPRQVLNANEVVECAVVGGSRRRLGMMGPARRTSGTGRPLVLGPSTERRTWACRTSQPYSASHGSVPIPSRGRRDSLNPAGSSGAGRGPVDGGGARTLLPTPSRLGASARRRALSGCYGSTRSSRRAPAPSSDSAVERTPELPHRQDGVLATRRPQWGNVLKRLSHRTEQHISGHRWRGSRSCAQGGTANGGRR